jgi:hypothetical protein
MKAVGIIASILITFTAQDAESFSTAAPPAASTLIPGEIDVSADYEKSSFPIAPENLIARAKQVLSPDLRISTKDDGACLADDFEFVAAVVGPISKQEYLNALGGFKLEYSFDIQQNTFSFTVDNRVW